MSTHFVKVILLLTNKYGIRSQTLNKIDDNSYFNTHLQSSISPRKQLEKENVLNPMFYTNKLLTVTIHLRQ